MQTPDQSSEEKQPLTDQSSKASDVSHETDHEQETPSLPSILPEQLEGKKTNRATDRGEEHEAIRRGLIYPPPPAFYEEISPAPTVSLNQVSPQNFPAHPARSSGETVAYPNPIARNSWQTSPPPNESAPQAGYPRYPQGQNYAGNQPPPFVAGPPSAKKPRKWTIIILSVLVAILLLSCSLCVWAGAPLFEQAYGQVYSIEVTGLQVVNDYYTELQNKQYAQAYRNLSTQGELQNISQATFIAQAEKQDNLYGAVLRYTPAQPDLSNYDGNAISTFSIKVAIARNKLSYTTQLQMTKVNNQWKISNFNHL